MMYRDNSCQNYENAPNINHVKAEYRNSFGFFTYSVQYRQTDGRTDGWAAAYKNLARLA